MNTIFYTFITFLCVVLIQEGFHVLDVWLTDRRLSRTKRDPEPPSEDSTKQP